MSYSLFMSIYLTVNYLFWGATAVAAVGFLADFFKTRFTMGRQS